MKLVAAITVVVTFGILTGCTSSKVAYRSKATLTPATEAGLFDVAFVIEDIADPANPTVVSSPRLRLLKGKEGNMSVGDDNSSIVCTALVDDASGKPEARTTVSIKKNGKEVWSDTQTVAVSK